VPGRETSCVVRVACMEMKDPNPHRSSHPTTRHGVLLGARIQMLRTLTATGSAAVAALSVGARYGYGAEGMFFAPSGSWLGVAFLRVFGVGGGRSPAAVSSLTDHPPASAAA
jgi:hypothetical protein